MPTLIRQPWACNCSINTEHNRGSVSERGGRQNVFLPIFYPVSQNAPYVSAGINPVPTLPRGNDGVAVQRGWNGVNVPNIPKVNAPKPPT